MLHILNQRFDTSCAANMLRVVDEEDDVVLIERAVQASLAPEWSGFKQCKGRVYLLSEDLASWGLLDAAMRHELPIVDMAGFITLAEGHERSVSWY